MNLKIIPITIRAANDFVEEHHRHNKKVQGARFAVGCISNNELVAVGIVGRPVARKLDNGLTAEITRLCARIGAPKNACSFLYGRCWRLGQQMGGTKMITYTFRSERNGSIKATGWKMIGATRGFKEHLAGWTTRPGREMQENVKEAKFRWEITPQ